MFHTTRPDAAKAIATEGFSGKRRTSQEGFSGAFFGEGTYFHTKQSDSNQYTSGTRQYGWGDETQIQAQSRAKKPFVVLATTKDVDPGKLMHDELVRTGHAKRGEKLTPAEITRRLQAVGFDSVEVRQQGFNHEIAGSQLVVFDPKKARAKPTRRVPGVVFKAAK